MKLRQWIRAWRPDRWRGWPERAYQGGRYQPRLLAVQSHLADCLDRAPRGPVRIISMCAGDGRDVIGVLASHPRRHDAAAWLVELSHRSVAAGNRHKTTVGLDDTVALLHADATAYATYRDIAPADVVLVCGVWGHVPAPERTRLVFGLAALCRPGAAVIWTRGVGRGINRYHEIALHFAPASWQSVRVSSTADGRWAVATNRYCGPPRPLPGAGHLFHFHARAGR